jgi:hypothetical protein
MNRGSRRNESGGTPVAGASIAAYSPKALNATADEGARDFAGKVTGGV